MLIVYGTRHYGKVDACGPHYLATRFVHIWYLPIFPVGSSWILSTDGNSYRAIPAKFSVKSMLAAYLRVWGPFAAIGALLGVLGAVQDDGVGSTDWIVEVAAAAGGALIAIVATVLAFAVIGRLSMDAKQKRATYALHTGLHIDPADLPTIAPDLRQQIFGAVVGRAQGLAGMGYRLPADPATQWSQVALDPTHNDAELVTAAFTLARLDATLSQGPYRTFMEQTHAALWNRIQQMRLPHLFQVT